MAISYFADKNEEPSNDQLLEVLGNSAVNWQALETFIQENYDAQPGFWKFPNKKAGWTWLIPVKKKMLLYRQPCENYFIATIVLGEKAVSKLLEDDVPEALKTIVSETKAYAEGRSITIEVKGDKEEQWVKTLLQYKLP